MNGDDQESNKQTNKRIYVGFTNSNPTFVFAIVSFFSERSHGIWWQNCFNNKPMFNQQAQE